MRQPLSLHSKVVIQLDHDAHIELSKRAAANDRTIRDEARYLLKKAMGSLPAPPVDIATTAVMMDAGDDGWGLNPDGYSAREVANRLCALRDASPLGAALLTERAADKQIIERLEKGLQDAENEATRWINESSLQAAKARKLEASQLPEGAVCEIVSERERQKSVEGWTTAHDDLHCFGELAKAAGWYALNAALIGRPDCLGDVSNPRHEAHKLFAGDTALQWPFALSWWKPKDARRDLVRAGALILAEIERIDREALRSKDPSHV